MTSRLFLEDNIKNASIPIVGSGNCFDRVLKDFLDESTAVARNQLRDTAINVVQSSCATYFSRYGLNEVGAGGAGLALKRTADPEKPANGLLYGKVQSGKTISSIASIALAKENGFQCFIVLTSDNVWLGKQTVSRFRDKLNYDAPKVFDWEQWRNAPEELAKQAKFHLESPKKGAVFISTKNVKHLEKLKTVLKAAGAWAYPTMILDDEADNASLNSNLSRIKAGSDVDPSRVFDCIEGIRGCVPSNIYLQVTATPQSLLLQSVSSPSKPGFLVVSQPGAEYIGGENFFVTGSNLCVAFEDTELDYFKGLSKVKVNGTDEIPNGLAKALCVFFLGSVYRSRVNDHNRETHTFLAHVCFRKQTHAQVAKLIGDFIENLDRVLMKKGKVTDTKRMQNLLNSAYDELAKTLGAKLQPLEELVGELGRTLSNAHPQVVDAESADAEPQYHPGMNILVGGNRLGRGVTIKGLMVTYYGRDPKVKTMDTVHQHARMFGYRKELLPVTRLFSSASLVEAFTIIHESDESMRSLMLDSKGDPSKSMVWVGPNMRPTRASVLNPADIDAYTPGEFVFPYYPKYSGADVVKATAILEKNLLDCHDDNDFVTISLDRALELLALCKSDSKDGKWDDSRVLKVVSALSDKRIGIDKVLLSVRRGASGLGLEMGQRQDGQAHKGLYDSKWRNACKEQAVNLPVLMLLKEAGKKQKQWADQAFFVPHLFFPSNLKFAFAFTYATETK